MAQAQAHARQRCHLAKMRAHHLAHGLAGAAQTAPAQQTREFTGVYAHGTGSGAQAATGAGVQAKVGKVGGDRARVFLRHFAAREFTPGHDALAR